MGLKSNLLYNVAQQRKETLVLEHCKNPWKETCKNGNITLYILFKGEKLPICRQCWSTIAEEEIDW
jgi:hypothetical protein